MTETADAGTGTAPAAEGVAVLGLGLMGAALTRALLAAGHPTTVWNRTAEKADPLVAAGAKRAATPADAVASSAIVVLCVSDSAVAGELLDATAAGIGDRKLVNLTSGTPEEARTLAQRAQDAGVDYLDGAIMAVPPLVGTPQALLLYSGSKTAFDAAEGSLAALGNPLYLGDDAGLASLYDLALLGSMWSMLIGYLNSAALVGSDGVSAATFTPVVSGWLTAMVGFLPVLAQEIDARDYTTDVSTIATSAAAIDHLIHASREQGIGVEVPVPLKALLDRGVAKGYGDASLSALIELIRAPAPTPAAAA